MKYERWLIPETDDAAVEALMDAGYPYLVSTVLASRGVVTPEQAAAHLDRERSLAINDATAGIVFTSGFAARQARMLLETKFDVVLDKETGSAQVVDKVTRRAANEVAKDLPRAIENAQRNRRQTSISR